MKTISIQTGETMSLEPSQTLAGTARDFAGFGREHGQLAQWLPAPAPRALPAVRPHPAKARSAESLWMPLPAEPIAEKLMMGLLVLAAVVAIAYGFSSMLDLVQDWARFDTLAGQLIQ